MDKNIKNHIINSLMDEDDHRLASPELEEWLAEGDEHQKLFEQYSRIWKQAGILAGINRFNSQRAWVKVNKGIERKNFFKQRMQSFAFVAVGMAASLILVLGLSIFSSVFRDEGAMLEVSTDYGSRTEAILPDGTVVELNAGSSLTYHFNEGKGIREIQFNGEGYFEVAKSKVPFVVNTKEGYGIKVLGTKFNLTAYGDENSILTTLVEGSVEVKSPNNMKMMLKPGQTAEYDKRARKLDYRDVEVSNMLGWKNNKLYMDNMSLQDVAQKLERRYDVVIEFENESMGAHYHYTGVLQEESIYDVLKALTRLSNINYKSKGKTFVLSEKK